jgi:outer membrane protein assembly factor BamB
MGSSTMQARSSTVARWLTAAALLATVVSCDSLGSVANPEVPLWANHPGNAMGVFARRELTAEARKVGEPYERAQPEIDAAHMRVFVGSSDHGLYALSTVDLATLWRFETAGAVQSAPLYDSRDDSVYFGSHDGALYKLRASDGKMLWRFASNAEIARQPLMHGDTLFVVNANDTLLSINPKTGKMNWYRHRTPAAGMEISGYAGATVIGEFIYTAFSDGVVMAYRVSDGSEAWAGPVDLAADAEQTRGGEDLRYLDVDTTPVAGKIGDTDVIYVASYEGGVYALDALSGSRQWANDGVTGATELILWTGPRKPRDGRPSAGQHRVLVASSGLTGLWGLDPDTGAELWRRDLPTGGITRAEPWAGALLVGTTRYGIFLVHPLDGGVLDGLHSGGAFAAPPAAYGRAAFLISNTGTLFGLFIAPPNEHGG